MNKKTLVFILGNLTAFGPFITDFYLPCLPELTSYFSASASMIQLSLTAGMLGLVAGQLFIGPISDKYGRRRPLLWCLLLVCRRLRETLADKDRLKMPVIKTFRCYVPVLRNGRYLVMNLLQSFSSAALIAYISASPFIFQNHFGLTPLEYSVCFAANALGLVVGSSVVMKIKHLENVTPWCSVGLFAAGVLVSVALWMEWPFVLFELALVLMLLCVGMITPVGITIALNSVSEHRGIASAMLGSFPFLLGGIVAPLTGLGNMIHSMTALVLLCSAVCLCLCAGGTVRSFGRQPCCQP